MAAAATDYINFIINHDNQGFSLIYQWLKTSLLEKNSYLKAYWDVTPQIEESRFTRLLEIEYQALTQNPDIEIIDTTSYPDPEFTPPPPPPPEVLAQMQQMGQPIPPTPQAPTLYDVRVRVTKNEGRVKLEYLNPEEVLISRRTRSVILDGEQFCAHRVLKTVSDLRLLGYDENLIEEAQSAGGDQMDFNTESIARHIKDEDYPYSFSDSLDPTTKAIWLTEAFFKVDYDGDGIAELRRIVFAHDGQIIFENDTIDDIPIIALTPMISPGKHYGTSLADLTQDLQEINTVLVRQILDNLALSNVPRVIVEDMACNESTIDDLVDHSPGRPIRVASAAGIQPFAIPFVGNTVLPILQYMGEIQEIRTGINRQNQGISPDDINQTATGVSLLQQQAAQRIELMARVFAETGFRILAQKILGLVIKYQDQPRQIKLSGQWVEMNPSDWNEQFDISINVGLGTGNKDSTIAHLMQVLTIQNQIVQTQGGVQGPLVSVQNIYETLEKLTETLGYKESFFTNPNSMPPTQPGQQPGHHPEVLKAQAEIQIAQMKSQADIQETRDRAALQAQIDSQRAQDQRQQEQVMFEHQMAMADRKFQQEMEQERQRAALRASLEMQHAQERHQAQMANSLIPNTLGA